VPRALTAPIRDAYPRRAMKSRSLSRLGALSWRAALLAVACVACGSRGRQDDVVRVAAAASLRDAFAALAAAFERTHPGVHVEPVFTSSGAATEQILHGAPFDLFCAADTAFPRRVEEQGRGVPGTFRVYARGRLALWIANRIGLEPTGLAVLADPRLKRIVVANPEAAPYGRAAVEALRAAGIFDAVAARLVYGQDAAQAVQQALAAGDAALLPLSLALAPAVRDAGRIWEVPAELHAPLEQACILVRDDPRARALLEFVLGAEGRGILADYGLEAP
jgi:molybdate transport system substrate-binding protein